MKESTRPNCKKEPATHGVDQPAQPTPAPAAILPPHPLDFAGTIRIMLGATASQTLAAHGERFLGVITHPDATCPPQAQGRMILTCLALDHDTLAAAFGVARGTHTARKIKAKPKAKPATAQTTTPKR